MNKRLDHYKELLQVLPRNNVKNSKSYLEKATIMQNAAIEYKKELIKEISKRYKNIIITDENEEVKSLENYLEGMKNNLYLLNEYNDSFEKSGLNEVLYDLRKFYKNDLTKVNNDILSALQKFQMVGITLSSRDFNYGEEVSEYMRMFFIESNPESNNLKATFDKLYWKSPNLIENIYVNFRHLYFDNRKTFEKFYENKLAELNVTNVEKFLMEYENSYRKYLELKSSDIKDLQDKFLNGELDIKEYDDTKIVKLKESMLSKEISPSEQDEMFLKLSYTLKEYKNYLNFKVIIDEVKKIYAEKSSNKNITKGILKNISKLEKKIKKSNRIIDFKRKIRGINTNVEKYFGIIDQTLVELNNLYKEYDISKFKEKIANELSDNSTLLDALKIAYAYKINLMKIIKGDNEEITDQEIKDDIDNLKDFIYYPNNNFVNNISISDMRDIVTIILDKYKLMNMIITKEQLEDNNLDIFISTVSKIIIGGYVGRGNIKYTDLVNACEMKKILEKENIEI